MKWKTFWQIVLLMSIAGAIIYIVSLKYHFEKAENIDTVLFRYNKITGKVMGFTTGLKGGNQVMSRGWKLLK